MFETIRPEQRYKSSRHTIWACDYHIIWCTKYRRQVLTSAVQTRLKEIIMEKQADYNYSVTALEIMPEHVHLLASIEPKFSVTEIVGKIKGYTSKVLREEYPSLKSRLPSLWTRSKFVSSCGGVTLQVIKDYIESQSGQ